MQFRPGHALNGDLMSTQALSSSGEMVRGKSYASYWTFGGGAGAALLVLGFGIPAVVLVFMSLFLDLGFGQLSDEMTIANYLRFFTDSYFLSVLLETVVLALAVSSICCLLGYPVAYFLARTRVRYRGMLIFLVAAPLLISVVIRNIGWVPILGMNGGINTLLLGLGLIDQPLILINNRIGVVIGMVHALLPFMILTLTTVIQRIGPSLEEAARGLGGSNFYVIRRVLLPLSAKGIVAGFLLVFALSISSYTTPAVMGGKRVTVMSTLIEQQVNSVLSYGFGAACSIILMVVALLITVASGRMSGKN